MTTAAIFLAIFAWWFSTGVIMLAVRQADRKGGAAHLWLTLGSTPLLALGVVAVGMSLQGQSLALIFAGFFGALAIWGWIELAFLTGLITGPVKSECPKGLAGADRFWRAFGTLSYHEVLLSAGLLALVVASDGAANRMALSTYLILYLARIFAKLNLFFGVPRINLEFLPEPLQHLKSYFRQGSVTPAFPAAITALTTLLVVCAERLISAQSPVSETGFALLTALSALALLEHWLMVLPLPDAKLWRWMLPAPQSKTQEESKTHGF